MTYISGMLGPSSTPTVSLYDAIYATLMNVGFEHVDTVSLSGRTYQMFKSPAALNTRNQDWYLNIHYTNSGYSSGCFVLRAFEDYNVSSSIGIRGPIRSSGTTIDPDTYSPFGNTGYALNSSNFAMYTNQGLFSLNSGNFYFQASITLDRVVISTNVSTSVLYAGNYLMTPEYEEFSGIYSYPLFSGVFRPYTQPNSWDTNDISCLTRTPKISTFDGISATSWIYHCGIDLTYAAGLLSSGMIGHGTQQFSEYPTIAPTIVRMMIGTNNTYSGSGGALVGTLDAVGTARVVTSAVVVGDTVTAGVDEWVVAALNGTVALLMRKQ